MKLFALLALSTILSFGQINISAGGSGNVSSGTLIAGSSLPLLSAGGGTNAVFRGDGTWVTWNGMALPTETRKWDGKITTKQHVDGTSHLIAAKELAPPGYIELAKSMGMRAPSEDEAELLKLIYQHGWKVYDFDKVDDYLWRQAASMKVNTRWVWKPMREKDNKSLDGTGVSWRETTGLGYVYADVYNKRVPMGVLEVAKCVMEDMPEAAFFVSDFEVIKPDPFLAVSTANLLKAGKIFIVARWDEPGFQEEPVTPGPLARK